MAEQTIDNHLFLLETRKNIDRDVINTELKSKQLLLLIFSSAHIRWKFQYYVAWPKDIAIKRYARQAVEFTCFKGISQVGPVIYIYIYTYKILIIKLCVSKRIYFSVYNVWGIRELQFGVHLAGFRQI
jgi:hypothetical protein